MSFKICNLASGSGGNCTYIETENSAILVDCGLGPRQLKWRLESREIRAEKIRAIFVTHEHLDHIGGAYKFAEKHKIPVYLTEGSWRGATKTSKGGAQSIWIKPEEKIAIDGLAVTPFAISHDTHEPVAYRVESDEKSAIILTDTGTMDQMDFQNFSDLDFLLIEANHDEIMLQNGPYHDFLKRRVLGDLGHLSNRQAGSWIQRILGANKNLKQIVLGHLSEKNNTPEAAVETVSGFVEPIRSVPIAVANQHEASDFYSV